jgi:hypothetical protein
MTQVAQHTPTDIKQERLDGPIHLWFGLTYSNYLVLHRSMMQSMPVGWQGRAVALFDELDAAFRHVERADSYEVTPAQAREYCDLSNQEMRTLGITRPDAPADDGDDTWEDRYYDRDGNEHQGQERVLVPLLSGDPVPHYNRGRTYLEPAA